MTLALSNRKRSALGLAVCSLASAGVFAAEWRITPRIEVRETYTDNVRLAPRGQEESDFVTEVMPGISIVGRGSRLQLNVDYTFDYKLYAKNSDANGHDDMLRANGLLDVWDRKLFLEASAGIGQQNISTLGPQTTSNINLNANRAQVRQASVSPYWISRLGTFANVQARYTWSQADSKGATRALDSESNTINLGLSSGSQFNDLGWSVNYSKQRIESSEDTFSRRDLETLTASASYRLLPTLSALLTVGRDDNSYGNARGSTGGNFYSAGVLWAPSTRTQVRAELGERYFGNTATFNAEHRTRLTTWNLSYVEQIVATPGLFSLPVNLDTASTIDRLFQSQIPDPIQREQVVQAFIVQNGLPAFLPSSTDFLTNQVSLSERWQGVFGLRGVRSNLLVTLFRDNRRSESTGQSVVATDPFSLSDKVIQTGYSAILSWRFSGRTTGSVSLGQTRNELTDIDRKDTDTNFRVGLTHQIQPKLRGSVEYRFVNRDSSAGAQDLRENAVLGTLSFAF